MNKPTVHDIAREAGVSLATVDRVLNARPGVRDETIARVQAAIDRIGFVRDTFAANLARQRLYRFAFVLPEGPGQFVGTLAEALTEAHASNVVDRVVLKVVHVPIQNPDAVARALAELAEAGMDGVALMTPETPQVRDAVARLKSEGLAVVAIASDLPSSMRDYFIGINNLSAGRTAGLLMGRFIRRPGEVLVVTNSLRSRDSLDRRLGFDAVMAEEFPEHRILPTVESFDDPVRMASVVSEVLARRPAVGGVYSMGTGNTELLGALRARVHSGDLVVIGHELTPTTRAALRNGEMSAVIAQNVGHLVRSAMRVMRALCDQRPIIEAQEQIRIDLIMRENIL
jgi:LacI family transcriptional regulator